MSSRASSAGGCCCMHTGSPQNQSGGEGTEVVVCGFDDVSFTKDDGDSSGRHRSQNLSFHQKTQNDKMMASFHSPHHIKSKRAKAPCPSLIKSNLAPNP